MRVERGLNGLLVVGMLGVSVLGMYYSENIVKLFPANTGKNIDLIYASCGTSIEVNVGDRVRLTRDRFVDVKNDGLEINVSYERSADFVDVFDSQVNQDKGDVDIKTWHSSFTNTSRFTPGKLFVSNWSVVSMQFYQDRQAATVNVVCN